MRVFLTLAMVGAGSSAHANDWDLCPPQPQLPTPRLEASGDPNATDAVADEITSSGSSHILTGNVELMKGEHRVGADRIEIDRAGDFAQASGNVYIQTGEAAIFSPGGEIRMDTGAFDLSQPNVLYPRYHGQGRAIRVQRDDQGIATLTAGTWSTCPEEDEDWSIHADEIQLNPNNRQGTAYHASLWFQGVPLVYTPWLRFPLGDERLTGFLPPTIGQSSDLGTTVTVPWYWNIAPNLDMTITPRSTWKRQSVQLQTETRWLGDAGFWEINLDYLPEDQVFGDDRHLSQVIQNGRYGHGLRTDINISDVSDDDYFEDSLGDTQSIVDEDHLESRADLFWNNDFGRSQLRLQTFRTLDEDISAQNRPYKQLPSITHSYSGNGPGLRFEFEGEFVDFDRDESDTATRTRVTPAVTHALETPGWFIRPRLAIDHTNYSIDRVTSTGPDSVDRTIPITSLDTGLIFERFGNSYYQTLEPRAFYVYIPEEDQDDIPIFDTDDLSFNFNRLFEERRFSGGDRIGDTNRLSLALTSRLLDTGTEILRGSVGVIHHFDDRKVTLPNGAPGTDDLSDVVGELAVRPTEHWRIQATAQWNPQEDETEKHNSQVSFRGPGGGIANLGYRFQDQTRRQTDISFAWPVSPRWNLLARSNYSLREDRRIESLLGLEYENCCWRLRTVARESIEADENDKDGFEHDKAILMELVLKGLGSFGDPTGERFEDAILGYDDPSN